MNTGNFFEHWERDILSGLCTKTLWSSLLTLHFKAASQAKERLEHWAADHGIVLSWEPTITKSGQRDQWVHFSHPR